ncbi:hypothetical protein N7540_009964 [Penicillium herquei]|nr:hypothetical protein N7540_009964 [Penicillium herquei]
MWEYYEGRSILVTGGSGFLGTAIVHRLLTSTSVSRVYLICRGGTEKLLSKWKQWLPDSTVDELHCPERLLVLDGDILLPSLGLLQSELDDIRTNVSIIIHAASSINLGSRLKTLSHPIIEATEMMVNLAFTCKRLDRFVYVSSAYSNAHLYYRTKDADLPVEEEFYELNHSCNILDELNEVRKYSTSRAYEGENFPWAYAYAKHLTERLLHHRFSEHASASQEQLLIVRPGIIGPSQCLPFPGYVMPMSAPGIMLAAAICLIMSRGIKIASEMDDPARDATADEVPVDVVTDRLLCHLAMGTSGCVHAVSGVQSRLKLDAWLQSVIQLRQIPWRISATWIRADCKSIEQHWICRLYVIMGTSFAFSEDKTIDLCQRLTDKERQDIQLLTKPKPSHALLNHAAAIRYAMDELSRKSWVVWLIVILFYADFGKISRQRKTTMQTMNLP